jgi:hypothetical protein
MKWQVCDARIGLARDGKDALDVLTDFSARARTRGRACSDHVVHVSDDGTVEVNYKGLRLYAVPAKS